MQSSMMPCPSYQPVVRIGNWFEDINLEEDKIRAFKNLRDDGQLLVEKTRRLFDSFHKDIELEAPKESVRFGAVVQLMPMKMKVCEDTHLNIRPALSVVITERVVRHSQKISEECELTIAPSVKPCVRNSYRIVSGDNNDRTNEELKYGQQFRLECIGGDEPVYVYCTPKRHDLSTMIRPTYESTKFGELNLPLGLCLRRRCGPGKEIPGAYCNWYCKHINPGKRFETEGTSLPSNHPLVITHVATNKNLAAENIVVQTLFGPEFLVSVQNYRDMYKRERWQNIWIISNGHNENVSIG